MKSISVSGYVHKCIMDLKDSDHKSADTVIIGLINEKQKLNKMVDILTDEISSKRLLVGEFDENEQNLIFQMLDGPLQIEDMDISDPAHSIEEKIKKYRR